MKVNYLSGLVTLGVMTIFLTSCNEPPQKEMDEAKAAIEDAKASGAEIYAVEELLTLEDSLNATLEDIAAQQSKLFGNYLDSKEQLVAVKTQAGELKILAETRKEEVRQQIQASLAEVQSLIEANKQLINEAPTGKEGAAALLAISGELTTIETTVNETAKAIENNDFQTSLNRLNSAKEKSIAINTELQDVITKYKANTKTRKG